MTLENIYYIGQTIAVVAIVGSLVFVAIQTRQNTRTLRAQAAWDAQASFAEINDMLAAGGAISEVSYKAFTATETLSPYERYLMHRLMRSLLQRAEAQFALYANGVLDAEVWRLRRGYLRGLLSNALVDEVWRAEKANSMFTAAFIAEIEGAEARDGPIFLGADAVGSAKGARS
ncbi:MAG TPA: hypothetical protein DDZ68_10155 [Parvularcula sp.]|nr:hypothetical protein [Parvularcula sp.]HBS30950.1 hypothetical protein [Parvularcula sp.]HBS35318.1 hypothetical protein [Parvularcula sp.]